MTWRTRVCLFGAATLCLAILFPWKSGSVAEAPGAPAPAPIQNAASSAPQSQPEAKPAQAMEPVSTPAETNAVALFKTWLGNAQTGAAAPDLDHGIALARVRRAALRDLIVQDPRAALEAAVPAHVRSQLPPQIAELLEEPISAQGDLNVIFARPRPGEENTCSEPVIRTVQTEGRFFYAYTYGRRLRQMSTPATSIIGIAVDDKLALLDRPYRVLEPEEAESVTSQQPAVTTGPCPVCGRELAGSEAPALVDTGGQILALHSSSEAAAFFTGPDGTIIWAAGGSGGTGTNSPVTPPTTSQGDKKFLFMRLRFADDAPTSEPSSDSQVRGDLDTTMRRFAEMSYGTLQGSYGFTPTMTLPKPRSGYMNGWSDVDGMGALMNDAKAQARLIASDPAFPGVPYPFHTTNYHLFVARWNGEPGGCCSYGGGGNAWIRWNGASVLLHEWGHAIGLPHANWWDPSTDDPIGPGTHQEYGNGFDNMGGGGIEEDFGAMHKALIKWLPSTNYWSVTTNGVYRIYAHDQPTRMGTNRYGLRTWRASRDDTYYWLEHRAYTVSGANALYWTNGVAVTREWDWELLDMTPGSSGAKNDCTLTIGRTWSDAAAGVHYTVIGRGTAPQPWVDVAVYFDDAAQPNHPPVSVVWANTYAPAAGASVALNSAAMDPDGDALAYAWDFGDGKISVNNSPAQSTSWSSAGTYVVRCTVSDRRGGTSIQSLVIKVGTPTDFTISGRTLALDGSPLAGVRVSEPSGKSAVSGSDGTFIIGRLAAGAYTLTPARYTHTFQPASRVITVGPGVTGADFTSTSRVGPGSPLSRQVWLNISGTTVANLTNNARFPNSPDRREIVADAFEAPLDWMDNYGQRLQGLFIPPMSGGYRFYIASDDYSELYLSPTPNAAQKTRIAYLNGATGSRNWTANSSQKSALFQLAAGQPYYLEALHKEGGGGDHVAVGIELPDGTMERPIAYHRLLPLGAPAGPDQVVAVQASTPTAIEAGGSGLLTFTRTGDTNSALGVYFRLTGSATYGGDYNATGLKLTIPAGQTSATLSISPINDSLSEPAETVLLGLVPGTNYTVDPSSASAAVTILDNDGSPTASIIASAPNASTAGPSPGQLTVLRGGPVTSPMTVSYVIGGTAINGTDYTLITNKVTFAAGQASADIPIIPTTVAGIQPPKTVMLTLAAGTGYSVIAPNTATVTIAQPGPGLGLLREWWSDIGNAGTVAGLTNFSGFPASPSGKEFLTTLAEGPRDSAENYGSRFRGWFIAPRSGPYYFFIASDDGGELWLGTNALAASKRRIAYVSGSTGYRSWTAQANQKSAAITLVAGQRYYLEALHAEAGGGDHCSIGVQFPDGLLERPITAQWLEPWSDKGIFVTVNASVPTAAEGGTQGEFTLSRTGDPATPLVAEFTITGTAINATDYSRLHTNVTFAIGQSQVKLPVQALLDTAVEGPETVILTLKTNAAYDIDLAPSAQVTIYADPPRATVALVDTFASEAGPNTGMVRFILPSATYGPVTFQYAVSGSATPGVDYDTLPGSITLAPGQSFTNLLITPLSDNLIEGTETVTIALLAGEGYLAGTPSATTLNIIDANTNRAPALTAIPDKTLFAGDTLSLTNTATDPDQPAQAISYSLAQSPQGAALDPQTGVLTWRPTLAQSPSVSRVDVVATDDGVPALSATQSFWVTVNRPMISIGDASLTPTGFLFSVRGDAGPDVTIHRSTNFTNWTLLLSTNAPVLPFTFLDADGTNQAGGFYQLRLSP